jgi:hypothetical protein
MELLIVEKTGWSKAVKIVRAATRVGSAPTNDIQLQSAQIAAVHLQILYSSAVPSSCKVVNLAGEVSVKVAEAVHPLATFATLDLRDGAEILLGDFRLKFNLPMTADVMQSARLIDASLVFAEAVLRTEYETVGVLTVKNAGEQPNCQFQVEIEGLPSDCYQIDPIPLMYPGAEEEVRIRLFHHRLSPPAGLQKVIFKITAPESYPGEKFVIQQSLFVSPVFDQSLELRDDAAAVRAEKAGETPPPAVMEPTAAAAPVTKLENLAPPTAGPVEQEPAPLSVAASAPEAVPQEPRASSGRLSPKSAGSDQPSQKKPLFSQPEPDFSKLKVVRGPADEFWNEQ